MREKVLPERVYDHSKTDGITKSGSQGSINFDVDGRDSSYAAAMTEFSICRSTSQMTRYTNPFGDL